MTAVDREESYSADRIAYGQPVRRPFRHSGELWVCTSISGSGLTASGRREHEAYRIFPVPMFTGTPTTYSERTGTAESAEAARNDLNGFYHGMAVKHTGETFVLSGPPVRFVTEDSVPHSDPIPETAEPLQLSLF